MTPEKAENQLRAGDGHGGLPEKRRGRKRGKLRETDGGGILAHVASQRKWDPRGREHKQCGGSIETRLREMSLSELPLHQGKKAIVHTARHFP